MLKITLTRRRTVWVAIGLLNLAVGAWLLNGWEHLPLSLLSEKTSRPSPQAEKDMRNMKGMGPSASPEAGSPQAYAMVAPVKQQLIGVTTAIVEKRRLETSVRAVGRVEYDERRIAHVNLRISGWVEDLFVNYTGQFVRKGQPLFTLYSPDLVATQDEYLLALRSRDKVKETPIPEVREQAERMIEAARDRLRLWTFTDEQIDELARRGKANTYITIYSPIGGYVIDKKVFKGMFVEPQLTIYTIADLSRVWVNAEIYEYEVPFVQVGQSATASFSAYPGEQFHGQVSYIYPYLNQQARTVKVRLELPNPRLQLKPDMYGDVMINVNRGSQLAVPEAALLDSGTRKLVFVVRGEGMFEPREVKVGPKIGSFYEIQEGLTLGERVVTSGNFLIDSESKLAAATNMMGALGMAGIKMEQAQMGKTDMEGMLAGEAPKTPASGKQEKQVDGVTIALSTVPAPPRVGDNRVRVHLTGPPKELANVTVELTYTMPMPGMTPASVSMQSREKDAYEAKVNLGMAGQWDLTVLVKRRDGRPLQIPFSVMVGGGMPGMPGM